MPSVGVWLSVEAITGRIGAREYLFLTGTSSTRLPATS